MEIWKDIDGFPGYQVSDYGRVKRLKDNVILKTYHDNDGYEKVALVAHDKSHRRKTIHRLVTEAFLGGPHPDLQVNHINGIKDDNRLSNLEWCTASENVKHAYESGMRRPSGGRGKIRPVRVLETGAIYANEADCAKAIGSDSGNVSKCLHGKANAVKGYHLEYADDICVKGEKKPFLYDYQMDAVNKLKNGCILCGSVGSGKSRTGLFYYFKENGGWIDKEKYTPMKPKCQDLYIITTAKKRDSLEWNGELANFLLSTDPKHNAMHGNKIVVDSWNNIGKYKDVEGAFFLLDEQRIVGSGAWVKAFLKIAKANNWILLTATPGDTYLDYLPVFLANGFFKNKTEFLREHVIYSRYTKYPKIDRYIGTQRLDRLRNRVLINMNYQRKINVHHEDIYCKYDIHKYKELIKTRWDPFKNEPIRDASGLCYAMRKIVNSDETRQVVLLEILESFPRIIVFYSFDYELDILKSLAYGEGVEFAQYNGHKHQPIPEGNSWVYAVQYNAGAEGWECTKTNCIVFFSQNYSYKIVTQAAGRIDRLNTPYTDLYYYHLKTRSGIDLAIAKVLRDKKKFNERKFTKWE